MKIYFVRHAQTTANKNQLIEGHTNGEITQEGITQAQTAADKIKKTHFEAAYTSDLTRCTQTAAIILAHHKLFAITDSRLRGRNYGPYEHKPVGSIDWDEEGNTFEDENSYSSRVKEFINEITHKHTKNVLVITHGGVIRRTLHQYCKKKQEEAMKTDIPNASVLVVDTQKNTCSHITH